MSEQKNELRQIITDALVSMVSGITGLVPPSGPGQIPDFIQAPIDRAVERISASLPVGVPDGWALVPAEPTPEMTEAGMSVDVAVYETHYCETQAIYAAMLAAAPTVKAEQVQCGMREALQNMLAAFDNPIARRKLGGEFAQEAISSAKAALGAASLPAAGSSDLTAVRCQCCATEYQHDSYDAGFIAGSGMCQVCDAAMPPKDLPAAGSAVDRVVATAPERIYLIIGDGCPRDADFSELGEVAWCEEEAEQGIEYVRAALSAQQSAPERVSVPRDLLADLISSDHDNRIQAERRLYALLASHGRGEA